MAGGGEDVGSVGDLAIVATDGQRAEVQGDAEFAGKVGATGDKGVLRLDLELAQHVRPVALDDVGHLGRLDVGGAGGGGITNERLHLGQVP